jgi:F-type H+-transporting ATPase subunit b
MTLTSTLATVSDAEVEGSAVLIPAIYDIVWSAVAFAIIFWLFRKFVLPQAQKALDARTAGIEAKLEQAERDRAEAQTLVEQYRAQMAEARGEAARLRAEGEAERSSIVSAARTEAQQAQQAVVAQAQARIASESATARQQLQHDVGVLAVQLAEKILGETLDERRTQATVDRFIADLEAAAADGATSAADSGAPR